ncbi:D-glucuronyl C5-epimerase family protein [Deinococcus hopiensis]|uniref:D-glucuronyl C5-epimerase family protein n=1 Tax=Deinococcus hopiensis TaxID=309885 RepID=UPI00148352C6|nr:D-glucuronyl C5-epimerase family protein [Deinococcus hopiensis]
MSIALGKSYWHMPQGLGKQFEPGKLLGYFNDMTAKTIWLGKTDKNGFPLVRVGGREVLFPTTLFQKALGHWDCSLNAEIEEVSRMGHRTDFLKVAEWAVSQQDTEGGWSVWSLVNLPSASPYSAMTQGEGISLLVRAYSLTGEEKFMVAARRALQPLLKDVSQGGVSREVNGKIILEELPAKEAKAVFNGWVFAIFGLYDLLLVGKDKMVDERLQITLKTLVNSLKDYNSGFWSYYDLSHNISSPFYHELHIAQLKALEITFLDHSAAFSVVRKEFERQLSNPIDKALSVIIKIGQKISKPTKEVVS